MIDSYIFGFLLSKINVFWDRTLDPITENIVVLNNESMSFKIGSKGHLSLKTNPQSVGYELSIDI